MLTSKYIPARIAIIIFIFLNIQISEAQEKWKICSGTNMNPTKDFVRDAFIFDKMNPNAPLKYVKVFVKLQEPSCPNVNDGYIEIVSIHDPNNPNSIATERGFETSFILITQNGDDYISVDKNILENAPPGEIHVKLKLLNTEKTFLSIDFTKNFYNEVYKAPTLVLAKRGYETCPNTSDGFVKFKELDDGVVNFSNKGQIVWENGFVGHDRMNMTAGLYRFRYKRNWLLNECCLDGTYTIYTNLCIAEISNEDFEFNYPGNWIINPGDAFVIENETGVFNKDGCVLIPIFMGSNDKAVAVKLNFAGQGELRIVDTDMMPLVVKQMSGSGSYSIQLNESTIKQFYLKITGTIGSIVDDISINTLEDDIPDIITSFGGPVETNNRSMGIISICTSDTITPYDGFSLEGGISPFTFAWDTDGDLVFDDADSLAHRVTFTDEGLYSIALLVEDRIGQRDTLFLDYEAFDAHELMLSVPDMDIEYKRIQSFSVCVDQDDFDLIINDNIGHLSSDSPGLIGNTFSPAIAGIGEHVIVLSGDLCDEIALMFIEVIEDPHVNVSLLSSIYQCNDPLDLNSLLSFQTDGLWSLNDTILLLTDTLHPSRLMTGVHKLSFNPGADFCQFPEDQFIEVLSMPVITFIPFTDSLNSTDPPLDLNVLLDPSTPMNGSWSGGNYIQATFFNPADLQPGLYPIVYTVGDDACQVSDTTFIKLVQSTGLEELLEMTNIAYYPNPSYDRLVVCISEAIMQDQMQIIIVDMQGRVVLQRKPNNPCNDFVTGHLDNGLYLLNILSGSGELLGVGKFVKL